MSRKTERLARLVTLQEKLRRVHETRHATLLGAAHAAEREAHAMIEAFDREGSLAALFPRNLHSRLTAAETRRQQALAAAGIEGGNVARAKLREEAARRDHAEARARDERSAAEKEMLDLLALRLRPRG